MTLNLCREIGLFEFSNENTKHHMKILIAISMLGVSSVFAADNRSAIPVP